MLNKPQIKAILTQERPGIEAHKQMWTPKHKERFDHSKIAPNAKNSAVSLLLFPQENELHFLLMQRVVNQSVHSGQIALPGGKQEPKESLLETAIRELEEETAIHLHQNDYIGKLSELYVPPSNYMMYPFVAYLTHTPTWQANPCEAERLFSCPITHLLNTNNLSSFSTTHGAKIVHYPAFLLNNKIVWGATAMILNEFKLLLIRYLNKNGQS